MSKFIQVEYQISIPNMKSKFFINVDNIMEFYFYAESKEDIPKFEALLNDHRKVFRSFETFDDYHIFLDVLINEKIMLRA